MVNRVLCVAEKPSLARAIANHLAGAGVHAHGISGNQYVKNYEFQYSFPQWGLCDVTMTSVLGHLHSHDFEDRFRKWYACDPSALFDAPIITIIDEKNQSVAKNIETQARRSQYLYIWTDCDREGENIGTEIRSVALTSNDRLSLPGKTVRARFSNIERAHIINAARNPVPIDEAQATAVASRIELDLRIGASFTRNLTLTLRPLITRRNDGEGNQVISYGSCQFPTLGFVVERYFRVRNFVPETFWSIDVMHERDGVKVNFRWSRNHLFDRMAVVVLFERCLSARNAKVTKVETKPTNHWKPFPLTTVELQKCGSRFLRMDSHRIMQVAERLYQQGWISYPRTETDQFDHAMDLRALVQKQTQESPWAQYAQQLLNGGFSPPRNGRNNDKAHPPIHPVNFVNPTQLSSEEQRVHEFVVRRFLACCSQDARGLRTQISILYGPETFDTSGLLVLERNFLDVYPYDKWTSSQELPQFREGEFFEPTDARVAEGKTCPPGYLTEPELIGLMDANGIGTDATMAEHIAKIKERQYVETRPQSWRSRREPEEENVDNDTNSNGVQRSGQGRGRGRGGRGNVNRRANSATNGVQEFIPTTLGVALVEGYESMGHDVSLAKPFLRKEMERKMRDICEGRKTRHEVVQETIDQYRAVYIRTQQRLDRLHAAVRRFVFGEDD